MSPKNPPPQDPRIAPKEMIVTRRKSAMQKRQLRDKDRSMKSITQLLKSSTRNRQSRKKTKLSPKLKSPKKKQQPAEDVQGKRRPKLRDRVWLKPKPNFKMVAKTNKRKLCTPRRETEIPVTASSNLQKAPNLSFSVELEISELVESASLCGDDLLEILTCPSPVWWEDPPDVTYSEKPICTLAPSEEPENLTNISNNVINSKCNDLKFIDKRRKLENVLGNIKIKKNIDGDGDRSESIDDELLNDEMLTSLENMDIPIEPIETKNDDKNEKSNEIMKESNDMTVIEVKNKKEDRNEVSNEIVTKLNDVNHEMKVPENLPPLQRNPMHAALEKNKQLHKTEDVHKSEVQQVQDTENIDITKRNLMNASPVLEKSDTKDLDTISDTNIKFIDKVEDKELDDTSQIILDKIKKFFQDKEKKNDKKEYITVYKIVDTEEKGVKVEDKELDDTPKIILDKTKKVFQDKEKKNDKTEFITVYKIFDTEEKEAKNDERSKMNYFYKKCKSIRKKYDVKDTNKKALELPNSEVKYCFKCSCIFETKECHYCAMAEKRECVCDKPKESCSDLCDNSGALGEVSVSSHSWRLY